MTRLLGIIAAVVVAIVIVGYYENHKSSSPDAVAATIGASSCDNSGYQVLSRFDGSKATIYDCTIGSRMRCVTYENGIATDATETVRLLFANTLGSSKPNCLG